MATRYRGFSTFDFLNRRSVGMTDAELVKRDLLNTIYTAKGERTMLTEFGTRIPLLVFEPMDSRTVDIIKQDLAAAVAVDPRLQLVDLYVAPVPDNNVITAFLEVRYLELDIEETIKLDIRVGG
jgi:phage baseplate assembly protein W